MSGGIHLNLAASSPEAMRELFELCMAETNTLHYDGKLIISPGNGSGNVYVFGERCPDCNGYGWQGPEMTTCVTCKGDKQIGPAWAADTLREMEGKE